MAVVEIPEAAEGGSCSTTVNLVGSGCDGAVAFEWIVTDQPLGSTVNIAASAALVTTATYDVKGNYTFKLCCYFEKEPD